MPSSRSALLSTGTTLPFTFTQSYTLRGYLMPKINFGSHEGSDVESRVRCYHRVCWSFTVNSMQGPLSVSWYTQQEMSATAAIIRCVI
jgi:hypothetical protein